MYQSMYQSIYDFTSKSPQTVFSQQKTTYGDDMHRESVEKPANPEEIEKFKKNMEDSSNAFIKLIFPKVEIEIHSRGGNSK